MTGTSATLTVGGWLALLAVAYVALSRGDVREWATRETGGAWVRRVGILAGVVAACAAGAFSLSPPAGVYLFGVAGVLAYVAGVLATAGALGTAFAATGEAAAVGERVRAFWYAAAHYYRATRSATTLSLVAFFLAAVVAGVAVDDAVRAAGALALGGVLACVSLLTVAGVFVPAGRNRQVADAVDRVRT